jgi:hypothetical protein
LTNASYLPENYFVASINLPFITIDHLPVYQKANQTIPN